MPRVVYDFVQQGADAVESAFRRIGDERRRSKQVPGGGSGGTDPAAREAEKQRKAQQKADERAAKDKTSTERREAAARVKASEKEAADKKRAADKQAKEELARQKKVEEERAKSERKQTAEREREARKRLRAEEREQGIKDRQRRRERAAMLTGVAAAGGAFIGSVASKGASAGMSLAETALKERIDLNDAALRVAINSRASGGDLASPVKLRDQFTQIGRDAKVKPVDVATGVQAFITKTGDAGKAMEFAPIVATAAKAADANLESVSKTAADLFQKFGIQTGEEMQKALAAIYFGGKSGAFELADFAEKMAPIASAGQRFGVDKGVEGVKTMQGLAQIAMSATGDRDKAATAVAATMRQLIGKTADLKAKGVRVFDEKTNRSRNVTDVLTETISRVGGVSAEKKAVGLKEIFGDEGIQMLSPLVDAYMGAVRGTKGSEKEKMAAGEAAVRAELDKAINAAGTWGEVVKDSAFAQDSSSSKLNQAWDELKGKVGEAMLPAFEKLAETLPRFADDVAAVGEAMGDLALVAVDLIETLRSIGILPELAAGRKAGTREREASKQLDDYMKSAAAGGFTESEQKRIDALKRNAAGASAESAFIKAFADADTGALTRSDAELDAKKYWDKIQQDPSGAASYANTMASMPRIPFLVSGQNEQQAALVKREADRVSSSGPDVKAAQSGLADFTRALAEAARAARSSGQASVDSIYAGG